MFVFRKQKRGEWGSYGTHAALTAPLAEPVEVARPWAGWKQEKQQKSAEKAGVGTTHTLARAVRKQKKYQGQKRKITAKIGENSSLPVLVSTKLDYTLDPKPHFRTELAGCGFKQHRPTKYYTAVGQTLGTTRIITQKEMERTYSIATIFRRDESLLSGNRKHT